MDSFPAGASGHSVPRLGGKFIEVGGQRFFVKGVTYGTFAPDSDGRQFPPPARIAGDFARMASAGINTVRTYTPPTEALLDLAAEHRLRVMTGLAWPQHIAFLDDRPLVREIRREAVETVCRLAGHPAALLFALGNEIPAGIVRWHGTRRIERFLSELYDEVKAAAPGALLTYVNYPPTEYLDLDTFDVCAFNVYLHREEALRAYLARLQHLAGARPLLLAEAGGDSIREGQEGQAAITGMQLRAAFAEGACGAIAYAWTDEWWRGGHAVRDWAFGLVDEARQPKPALDVVSQIYADAPFPPHDRLSWPRVSVVVCAYDAADTIGSCLASLSRLNYPDYEVIVVNDGSRDATSEIARRHEHVRVIETPNGGLSVARNVGLAEATGSIVAYTDADVKVDPDWLTYLVQPILAGGVCGAGGPNEVPADDPWIAQAVARAPGGPTHVMLDDRIAEHVPGCNMAFDRDALLAVGGFNPVYVRAGDDVDICWRLQARGQRIGFAPSALVWHQRRNSVSAYWRQQVGYGEGEAWLEAHHPEKFLAGRPLWQGRIYSPLPFLRSSTGRRVNSGVWGTAAFPSVYMPPLPNWHFVPHSPVWLAASLVLLVAGVIGLITDTGAPWLLLTAGLAGCGATAGRCLLFGWRSDLRNVPPVGTLSAARSRVAYRLLIAWLHLIQPLARLRGRLRGLSEPQPLAPQHVTRHPWKAPVFALRDASASARLLLGGTVDRICWSESRLSHTMLMSELVGVLRAARPAPLVDVDEGWRADRDFSLAIGRWGWLRVQTVLEDHEKGRSLFRVRARLQPSVAGALQGLFLVALLAGGAGAATALNQPSTSVALAAVSAAAILARAAWQATRAVAVLDRAVSRVAAAAGLIRLRAASPVSVVGQSAETTFSRG
jgi:GT2 family glycosyltransferase